MKKWLCITFVLLMWACGSRKRELKVSTTKKDVVQTINNDLVTNTRIERRADVTIYTPIDPTMPMVLPDGTISKNTKIEKRKETEAQTQNKTDKTQEIKKETSASKNKNVTAQSERGDFWRSFALPVGLGLGLALLVAAFLYFRRRD